MTGREHYFYFPDFRPCGSRLPSHSIAIRVIPLAVLKQRAATLTTNEFFINREKGHTACGIETARRIAASNSALAYREKGHTACGIETCRRTEVPLDIRHREKGHTACGIETRAKYNSAETYSAIAKRVIPLAVLKHAQCVVLVELPANREKGHTACGIETCANVAWPFVHFKSRLGSCCLRHRTEKAVQSIFGLDGFFVARGRCNEYILLFIDTPQGECYHYSGRRPSGKVVPMGLFLLHNGGGNRT